MEILRDRITKKLNPSKSPFDYELYKYEDLQNQWIIHQGYLQYLYNTTILGDSLFRIYLVVLTRISMENLGDIIGVYLFFDEKKSASYFFSIDQKTQINDRCYRNIRPKPKCFLMELIFTDKEKSEIFGTKDNSERQIWMEMFKNIFSKPNISIPVSDSLYLSPVDLPISVKNRALVHPEFNRKQNQTESSPYSIVEPTDYSRSKTDLSFQILNWNEIFYSNVNDDYKSILAKTGDYGAFLIRPQSKKTSSSDHDYTLCVYYQSNNIRCFAIHQLANRRNEYSLSIKDPRSFVDMIQLCHYYRTNPLPSLTTIFYLKNPYKSYENDYHYIE